jgi:predicted metal-dependent phosphoesterase TrpH
MDLRDLASLCRAQGAAVVLAHPYRDGTPDDRAAEWIDAVEVGSTSFGREMASRAHDLAARWSKPRVASSDAHSLSSVGWAFTAFPKPPGDEKELAAMIRAGLGAPVIPRAFTY